MELNEFEFFRDATLQICSSLDIEKALFNCLQYIRSFIPASHVALSLFEPGSGSVVKMLIIDHLGGRKSLPPIPLSRDSAHDLRAMVATGRISTIEKLEDYPAAGFLSPYVDLANHSALIMDLGMEGKNIGAFIILAEGGAVFTKERAELASLLRGPLSIAMSNALRYDELEKLKDLLYAENRELSRALRRRFAGGEIIGAEFGLKQAMDMVRQVAPLDSPVILLGETGVGKEVVANAIHATSSRKDGPLVVVNCGAIPENLLDSELFGHEKGAFTGAIAQKRGYFERAAGGTIFLDEIGELPLQAQVRLLRVLQNKTVERVGGTKTIAVDVRIIAATHRDLEELVRTGAFREDLWFRLNVFPIVIPPLRDRLEDIPALAHHFIATKSKELKVYPQPSIAVEEIERLKAYHWPGNVRELENLIERELIHNLGKGSSGRLRFDHLQMPEKTEDAVLEHRNGSELITLEELVSRHIRRTLQNTNGRISGPRGAARLLGVNPHTLRSRMMKLGIPFKYS
ncbi:MAG: sigma 54-interacting transcriptional regulator [Syntrophobacteraceae bacterium]|nr:sigma 54-interacting transcriptional regulator [Syntrophobacteraceae bacterium]